MSGTALAAGFFAARVPVASAIPLTGDRWLAPFRSLGTGG